MPYLETPSHLLKTIELKDQQVTFSLFVYKSRRDPIMATGEKEKKQKAKD